MAFEGYTFKETQLPPIVIDNPCIAFVSGSGPNIAGHCLVYFGKTSGFYHVCSVIGYPCYIPTNEFDRYLRENDKDVKGFVGMRKLVPKPNRIAEWMPSRMRSLWFWGAILNNCVTFTEDVYSKGGEPVSFFSNLPHVVLATLAISGFPIYDRPDRW